MTPQELKNSILQLAIQGKLVDQRPEEGTAEDLYRQIQAEKQALIKAGKLKKEKPLPEITEDEKPFDIPESWMWVRLGDSFCIEMGQSPDGSSVSENKGGIEFHQGKVYFGKKYLELSPQSTSAPTKIAEPNSVLLCVRAPVGKVNIVSRRICIGRGLCSIMPIAGMSEDFVYYLLTTYEKVFIRKATGTTFVAITGEVVKNQLIPLPPLAEQKRIVAKIEEILPLIDRYEQAWTKLEEFNKRFPADMQKSLLQLAIQGKLVDQRPEEGTGEDLYRQILSEKQALIKSGKIKKEKPLPEITEDEKPFDIPDSWKWTRLSNLAVINGGYAFKSTDYSQNGVRVVRISDFNENGFVNTKIVRHPYTKEYEPFLLEPNDILLCMTGGTVGKSFFVKQMNEPMMVNQRVATIKVRYALPEYIYLNVNTQVHTKKKNSEADNK